MTKKIVSLLLILCLVLGTAPAAFASAEPEEPAAAEMMEVPEEPLSAAEENMDEIIAETEEAPEETAVEEAPEEAGEASPEEPVVVTVPVAQPATYTLPSGEEIAVDPEDPMYAEYMNAPALMSAWNEITTYQSFQPRSVAGETVRPGIDVSSWQGTIDWKKVAASGVEFAFLRGAYRGTGTGKIVKDSRFDEYMKGATAAGLKVGVYIYSQAITPEEGREEAQFLMDICKNYTFEFPLVIDYEYYGKDGRLYNAKLNNRERTDVCLAFFDELEDTRFDAMVYGNLSMLKNDLYAGELDRVWMAHYATKTTYAGAYEFWQCTDRGSISGISGNVDLNFWFDTAASSPFTDVTAGDWYFDTVLSAYEQGIVSGMGDDTFAPHDWALRGQVVTMLHRLCGQPAAGEASGFTDLTETYYIPAVNWATDAGIVKGYSDTEFDPRGTITRQDLVTILYRMEKEPAVSGDLSAFSDGADVRDYAEDAVLWAVKNGVINGYEDDTLKPGSSASRAEVCAILMRYAALDN